MSLFKEIYRIEPARLKGWDYAGYGWYFVTICTKDRSCIFGDVVEGEMRLSSIGKMVTEEWLKAPELRSYVTLDVWVIMPNHLHGILIIDNEDRVVETPCHGVSDTTVETPQRGVSTDRRNPWSSGCLGAVIGQFKIACTKRIRAAGYPDFAWQSRFYDHVIRSEKSLNKIREYITNNPMQWEMDQENPANFQKTATPKATSDSGVR